MTDLDDVTDAELKAEMERREQRGAVGRIPLTTPDFKTLVEYVTKGVERVEATGREPKDFRQHVYELALGAVYGPDLWGWYNDRLDR